MDRAADPSALAIGELVGPHGLRGVVKVQLYNRDSDALKPGLRVELRRDQARAVFYTVLSVESVTSKGQARVLLQGVGDRDVAEALRGAVLWVARADLPPLSADEFYLADVIGLPVLRHHAGEEQSLGEVTSYISNGAQDLFEVAWTSPAGARHTWLLPVLPQFIEDLGSDALRVRLPLGMLPDPLELEDAP